MSEAYDNQEHAPKRGVKAQDQDEYDAKGTGKKYVEKHDAYKEQDKAPQGRGNRGPTQSDGGPIEGWDKSVPPHGAYKAQHFAPPKGNQKSEEASLGFKFEEHADYLGHFKREKFLRMGHNDVDPDPTPSSDGSLASEATSFFNRISSGSDQAKPEETKDQKYDRIRKQNSDNVND